MTRNRNGPVIVTRKPDEIAVVARLLGHDDVYVFPTASGAKWRVDCVCGWMSTGTVLQLEAVKKARAHLERAVTGLDQYARSHGLSPSQALSEFALSDSELSEQDAIVQLRIEHRVSQEAMSDGHAIL